MVNKKAIIASVATLVILGGAIGVGAATNSKTNAENKINPTEKSTIISAEEAAEVAVKETGGTIKSIEFEKDDGYLVYEVEVVKDGYDDDIEIEIDAVTGSVTKMEDDYHNVVHPDDKTSKQTQQKAIISMEKAIAIAKKDTPGKVTEVDLELDDGYYEIELKSGKKEVEMKISVTDGAILKKEVDIDDDHDN